MRYRLVVLLMLLCSATAAPAQVSIGIGLPGVSIGINLPLFPELVPVPGYPVYYAPQLDSNYFFYDGMYWVYQGDDWYASSWYNGPWGRVGPEFVPLYVLRIPVRYYRRPPAYFRGWQRDAPPRWGEHWGHDWDQRRSGWDKWDRRSAPAPAPLPTYQRNYAGDRYPRVEQQQALHSQNYRYQPKEPVVREHYQQQKAPVAPAPSERGRQAEPQQKSPRQEAAPRPQPLPSPQQGGRDVPRSAPPQGQEKGPQGMGAPREPNRGQGQGQENQQQKAQGVPAPAQRGTQAEPQPKSPRQEATPRPQPLPPPQQAGRGVPRSEPPQGQEKGPEGKGAVREPNRGQGQGQEKDREKSDEPRQERTR